MANDPRYRTGADIRVPRIRVIGPDGAQLGIMATEEALRRAADAGLDLVEINPRGAPPVCKIMSLAQFRRGLLSGSRSN